jgi:putative two-component system response regulator
MEPTIPLTSKQILVVEENDNVRNAVITTLQIENYQVLEAKNIKDAFEILQKHTPDLILSDVNLLKLSGIDLFSKIRNENRLKAIPFIFLVANPQSDLIGTIRELGVEDWITKPINAERLTRIINSRLLRAAEVKIAHIDQAYLETVEVLANAVEGRDRYTRGHIERVTTYSVWIAEKLRWPSENIRILQFGARLHDIGKIIVPDQILNKPGRLNPEEWELMRKHPVAGAKIIKKISHLEEAVPYILYHHEKWNGEGYPEGRKGRDIPIGARILMIADVFDAITTPRPYRPAQTREITLEIISQKSGSHFDPDLVPIFIDVIRNRIWSSKY